MKHHRRRRPPRTPRTSPSVLERIQVDVAGIDCGAAEHFVSVPPDRDPTPVQSFRTFTADLERLADWLLACGITSVAMEATGVYWIPVYDILEARGLEVTAPPGCTDMPLGCVRTVPQRTSWAGRRPRTAGCLTGLTRRMCASRSSRYWPVLHSASARFEVRFKTSRRGRAR